MSDRRTKLRLVPVNTPSNCDYCERERDRCAKLVKDYKFAGSSDLGIICEKCFSRLVDEFAFLMRWGTPLQEESEYDEPLSNDTDWSKVDFKSRNPKPLFDSSPESE